ncbi:phage antirepressor KilAC domain-containing protein [Paenibacillus sp. DMB20]|uniref:phage antirepressor KilAC domain-containing protein n=1 Tax=Paenibacillus sp. DMB20 TaxID=1642570 RepID=UPI000627CE9B|nr:phage antirepressor KilAC domain-containing protein [Paenibacillus sp. DMB20]KKO51161.1 hypothetical protein XI25_29690 [Paenibacillus sp. DMB20]
MKDLILFEGNEVIILMPQDVNFKFNGDFLIKAKDVASVLEYQGTSATQEVLKFVKQNQVYLVKKSNMVNRHIRIHNTGETFITNLALNRVLGKSEKPKAEPFQDWLYEDVLPSVSKRGVYLTPAAIEKTLTDPDFIISMATEIKQERQKRLAAEMLLKAHAPKIAYYDIILKSKSTVTTTQIAKDYGLTANELNKILKEQKIQYKVGDQWVLYKKYADKGYTQSETFNFTHTDGTPDVRMNTKWTQRGRIFIHQILTELGIKPNIEKEYCDAN